tara:strand:- start:15 stop:287 length:273 start_codon:yes stop_codon:yes gene_type:complete
LLLKKISLIKYALNVKYIATNPSIYPRINSKLKRARVIIKNNKLYLKSKTLTDRISGGKYISKNANFGNILFHPPIKVPREAANAGAIKG